MCIAEVELLKTEWATTRLEFEVRPDLAQLQQRSLSWLLSSRIIISAVRCRKWDSGSCRSYSVFYDSVNCTETINEVYDYEDFARRLTDAINPIMVGEDLAGENLAGKCIDEDTYCTFEEGNPAVTLVNKVVPHSVFEMTTAQRDMLMSFYGYDWWTLDALQQTL